MQKLESTAALNTGVKEKIRILEGEINGLHGDISTRMADLHAINSKVPNAWNKAGIDITMPDGSRIRVSKLGALLENLGKAMAKR